MSSDHTAKRQKLMAASYAPPPNAILPSMDITDFREDPEERKWTKPFTFVLGADTQFGFIAWNLLNLPEPNWDREIALTRDVIRAINEMTPKPRFFIICGDMLDAYPYSRNAGMKDQICGTLPRREDQYQDFVKLLGELDPEVKLVCVCGNHDLGDDFNRNTVKVYRRQFGQDYFSFWVGGVKFVVLNSQYIFAPEKVPLETQNQWEFMDSISDQSAKHIVAFQHIPYFVESPDESDNLNQQIPKSQRFQYLEKLRDAGVRYIFCGHAHQNGGGYYKDIEQTVTGAIGGPLGKDPSGYRIVTVEEERILHKYIPIRKTTAQH